MPLDPDIIQSLVRTIEVKDLCTAAHTWRVVLYTRALAERLGMDRATLSRFTTAAALHDLGKIDIPDDILRKPSALTPDEFAIMQNHTVYGWERLREMGEDDPLLLSVVRSHHERMDGHGYPDALVGEQIHLAARLFAVVDSFDAMTGARPYHAGGGLNAAGDALRSIESQTGTHYCPASVHLLADALNTGQLDWILVNFNDGSTLPSFAGPDTAERLSREFQSTSRPVAR